MQKSYRPVGWLGFILRSKIYIDFSKYSFEECSSRLQKELKNFEHDTVLSAVSNNSSAVKIEIKSCARSLTQDQIVEYLKSKNANGSIILNLMPCDGDLLEQLFRTLKAATEFFHSTLRADSKTSLRDIVFFYQCIEKVITRFLTNLI